MKLLVLILTPLPLFAQTPLPVPSPYAICDQIANAEDFDLRSLYRALVLPSVFQVAGEPPNTRLNCLGRACTADVQEIGELADADRPTHVLSICWSYRVMYRFVFFHESRSRPNAWTVIAHHDASHDAGMLSSGGGKPFRLGYVTTRGTGGAYGFERWYDVSSAAIVPMHEVVTRGVEANAQPARILNALLVSEKSTSTEDILTYVFHVEFSTGGADPPFTYLFDEHRTVRFTRPKLEGRYKFDPARSEMTEEQIKRFSAWTQPKMGTVDPPPAIFFAFARTALLRLARSGTADQKQWLTNYLTAAPASPIKTELTRALAAHSPSVR